MHVTEKQLWCWKHNKKEHGCKPKKSILFLFNIYIIAINYAGLFQTVRFNSAYQTSDIKDNFF